MISFTRVTRTALPVLALLSAGCLLAACAAPTHATDGAASSAEGVSATTQLGPRQQIIAGELRTLRTS